MNLFYDMEDIEAFHSGWEIEQDFQQIKVRIMNRKVALLYSRAFTSAHRETC